VSYRTTCPHCVSVFRLGTDQLDAAQGWVQCSVCGAAFDAHLSLLMEDGSPLPPVEPEIIEAPQPEEEIEALEPERQETSPAPTRQDLPGEPVTETADTAEETLAADTPRGIIQRADPLDLPSIILIDPNTTVSDDPGPMPQVYDTSAYPNAPTAQQDLPAATSAQPAHPPAARIEYATPLPGSARLQLPSRRLSPWVWGVASTLLLLVLLAQSAYFLRDTLVSRLPQTRPAFEQVCAVAGCTLSLPKNLGLLQIVGSDLQTEAPARGTPAGAPLLRSDPSAASGRLKLTLTLGNRAHHVQAWPVLVLTLTDQRNRPLARRSFAPSEYLEDAQRIAGGIPPRSEQPLSLPLTVHNLAPMGFDLRLTY
jgi:predicted Zn finger-like uncharacterized protein